MKELNEFKKKVEDFRHHYFIMYGVKLDDEILYLFIRMNEMQKDLKREIKQLPVVQYNSRLDYFFNGLGKRLVLVLFVVNSIIALLNIVLFFKMAF